MASGKNFAGWVGGSYVTAAEAIVKDEYGGNTSAFIADLVEQRVNHGPPKVLSNPSALVDLAEAVHPTIAEELRAALSANATNQPRALVRLLEAALDAVTRGVDLTKPLSVFTSEQEMAAYLAAHQSGPAFLAKLRNLVETASPEWTHGGSGAGDHPIPNSPVTQGLDAERKRRAAQAEARPGAAKSPRTAKGPHPRAQGEAS